MPSKVAQELKVRTLKVKLARPHVRLISRNLGNGDNGATVRTVDTFCRPQERGRSPAGKLNLRGLDNIPVLSTLILHLISYI